jgi:hypothetical protein
LAVSAARMGKEIALDLRGCNYSQVKKEVDRGKRVERQRKNKGKGEKRNEERNEKRNDKRNERVLELEFSRELMR